MKPAVPGMDRIVMYIIQVSLEIPLPSWCPWNSNPGKAYAKYSLISPVLIFILIITYNV